MTVRRIGDSNAMTCRDFQRGWDELLDAEARSAALADALENAPPGADRRRDNDRPADGDGESEGPAILAAHAAECPACRPIAARYQVLRQSIRAWRQPPAPPPGLVDRILIAAAEPAPAIWRPAVARPWRDSPYRLSIVSGLAAAGLIGLVLAGTIRWYVHPVDRQDPSAVAIHPPDRHRQAADPGQATATATDPSRSFNRALADATSATWDLARSASEPAARLGREVLDPGGEPGSSPPGAVATAASDGRDEGIARLVSVPVPSFEPLAPEASAVIQQVGDQLSAGVRPLSSTARHAFGFLLGPDHRPHTEPATGSTL